MTVTTEVQTGRPQRVEQSRARYPDEEGYVERDGVRTFYEVYGRGAPTILFLSPWSIVHSRCWKMQIPYFARHGRVLTFDARGNGRSDRPMGPMAYDEREFAADALAVMDATDTASALLVSHSLSAGRALLLCAEHPERVAGSVFIGPRVELVPVEPALLAPGLPRLPRVLHVADVHGAPLDEADRGLRRLGARDPRRDADRDRGEP
jgi:pimeloyl-ACP methyl ester carboxylesterase